jgi:hypothetical protein
VRDVWGVWVVWGKEIREFREIREKVNMEGNASFSCPMGKEKEAYRKVRHVNLKLVSS